MDVLAEFSSSLVVAAAVLIVAWLGKERYDAKFEAVDGRLGRLEEDVREVRGETRGVRSELGGEIQAVRSELGGEIRELRSELGGEIGGLRSDITQIALAVGARLRPDAS